MYKHLHEYSLVIGLEVHPHSIETNMKMNSRGPDNVVFLDFHNNLIQLKGFVDMVELDINLWFSRDTFLKDLERGLDQIFGGQIFEHAA